MRNVTKNGLKNVFPFVDLTNNVVTMNDGKPKYATVIDMRDVDVTDCFASSGPYGLVYKQSPALPVLPNTLEELKSIKFTVSLKSNDKGVVPDGISLGIFDGSVYDMFKYTANKMFVTRGGRNGWAASSQSSIDVQFDDVVVGTIDKENRFKVTVNGETAVDMIDNNGGVGTAIRDIYDAVKNGRFGIIKNGIMASVKDTSVYNVVKVEFEY